MSAAQRGKQKKKGKRFGGGQQPRIHPVVTQTRDKIIKCPLCDQVFCLVVEVQPGAFKLEQARHYIGGVSAPSFRRMIQRGLIRPNRSLRILTFPRAELDRYLTDNLSQR